MLTIPASSETDYRIIGIDPGTDTLGIGLVSIDLLVHEVTVLDGHTFVAHQHLTHADSLIETLGARQTRLLKLSAGLSVALDHCKPHAVVCETPYLDRFPEAFRALVECLAMIRLCLYQYDPGMLLRTVDPASAKAAIGVSGKSRDKQAVFLAMTHLSGLQWSPTVDPLALDEHAIDALLMCCYYVQQLGYTL